jgi:uncharacterized membrane protein YhaH (DUF805 family)
MTYNYPAQSYLSKTVLSGVFAGIIGTLSNLAFDYFFRSYTEFSPSQIINVSTIIFATMLFFTVAGVIYYFLSSFIKKGQIVYILFYAAIALFCLNWGMHVQRSADLKVSAEFRILFVGILSISFILATLFIPYLMNHQSIFLDEND